ncbi:MAG TPA: YqgE/AlgH family protein [Gemmatales bacterium]|nr:YqgE/AlgH family protein [Gemmatales bacterium]HMP60003.1 YqgE/AlgH family protein [Gemmatales bacterium]
MKSLKGSLLIASPTLLDPNFVKTVVLVFEHSENGAGGVVLNRQTDKTVADIAEQVFELESDWHKPLHLGGPVPGPVCAAHVLEHLADMEILPGVYGAIDPAKLVQVVEQSVEPSLFVVNYSGWGPGQLEGELEEDSWKVLPARPEHIFWKKEQDLWKAVMGELVGAKLGDALGVRFRPPDPRMN